MRRAGEASLVLVAALLAAGPGIATADEPEAAPPSEPAPSPEPAPPPEHAEPPEPAPAPEHPEAGAAKMSVTAEAGAEADTNVQRLETGPGLMTQPTAAPVARLGARLSRVDRALGGAYALGIGALSRTVLSGEDDLSPENVVLLSGDLRWMRPLGARGASVGLALVGIDALPLTDGVGSRTFRTLGGEAVLALRGGEQRAITVAIGGRDFVYKPDHDYDWRGPTASVQLDLTLWERDGGARSVELAVQLGFEARAYESAANASACPEGTPPSEDCYAGTSLRRSDRFQRGGLELTWTGRVVAAAAYQLAVTDSNSYGQSVVRHRVSASATTNLPWRLYGTALATLQLDNYPDGLLERDVITQTFTTLDDENRSSLQARIARHVGRWWAIEGRAAIWRNVGSDLDTAFRRTVILLGAVYSR